MLTLFWDDCISHLHLVLTCHLSQPQHSSVQHILNDRESLHTAQDSGIQSPSHQPIIGPTVVNAAVTTLLFLAVDRCWLVYFYCLMLKCKAYW